jgi:hypothetical protein
MGEGSSGSGPTSPPRAGDDEGRHARSADEPGTQIVPANPYQPTYQPTYVPPGRPEPDVMPPQPATVAVVRPPEAAAATDVRRYGPGVPASQAGVAAESVWRTGQRPGSPPRQARLRRVRRLLGLALTVALLIAAGVVVWLRFFDHPAFGVTDVAITGQVKTSCGMDVTGRIATNGSAGTVSYQWVFRPQTQAPQPLNQTVVSGQHDVYVTVAVEGQGHGTASQTVTLDVLGSHPDSASTTVTISC